jgi:uncharacterized protein YdhG (YjbR/CyaY superfamily)
VLLDPGQGHAEGCRQIADRGVSLAQTLEDAAAGWIGDRREGLIEVDRILNHVVHYSVTGAGAQGGNHGRKGDPVMKGMKARPKVRTIDDYLAALSDDKRKALERLRKTIHSVAPEAEECISYQLAAFRLHGKPLVAFGATATHCAFYPMSGTTVEAHRDELRKYDTSKGTIRFTAADPLPAALVRKLVKARMAENAARQTSRTRRERAP